MRLLTSHIFVSSLRSRQKAKAKREADKKAKELESMDQEIEEQTQQIMVRAIG